MSWNKGLASSKSIEWETPKEYFNLINEEFHFETDVCATIENRKCEKYYTKEEDGLLKEWKGICWMNPPYGKEISLWCEKAYKESRKDGTIVVGLLPARTDTRWFHNYIYKKAEIRFIKGRLKFGGGNSAPFPSMLIIWKHKKNE